MTVHRYPSRIRLLAALAFLTLPGPHAAAATPGNAPAGKPNIVFIFSDDHAYQAISAYGDPRNLIETPAIDRLANEGMRFDRCLVTNSICGPSRAVILTGKYSHVNGFYNNTNSRFDGAQDTFPKRLQTAGYQTAMIGKWHLVTDPTGFDEWHILPGQGVYYNPPMIHNGQNVKHEGYTTDIITDLSLDWLKSRDRDKPFMLMMQHKAPHREWAPALRHLGHDNDRRYPEPPTLFDDYAGRGAPERDQDMTIAKTMNDVDLKLVPPRQLTPAQLEKWNAYYEPRNQAFRDANLTGQDLVRWKYNRYMHDYLGCIKAVDESVGKLLKYLDDEGLAENTIVVYNSDQGFYLGCIKAVDESVGRMLKYLDDEGLADNTIVVYNSDQGFYLGEHGWFDKRWIFEESLRTPLLVRWPGTTRPGSVNHDLVSNVDLAETLLEAASQSVPADMQGKSLVPILKGQTPADWRQAFYYHYFEFPGPHDVRKHYGVVTDRYKLVHFYEPDVDLWELFDLKTDPLELASVYGQPAYADTQKQLHQVLDRLRAELNVPAQDPPESMIPARNQNPPQKKAATKKAAAKASR